MKYEYCLYKTDLGYISLIKELGQQPPYYITGLTFIPRKKLTSRIVDYLIYRYVDREKRKYVFFRNLYYSDDQFFNCNPPFKSRELVYSYVTK